MIVQVFKQMFSNLFHTYVQRILFAVSKMGLHNPLYYKPRTLLCTMRCIRGEVTDLSSNSVCMSF